MGRMHKSELCFTGCPSHPYYQTLLPTTSLPIQYLAFVIVQIRYQTDFNNKHKSKKLYLTTKTINDYLALLIVLYICRRICTFSYVTTQTETQKTNLFGAINKDIEISSVFFVRCRFYSNNRFCKQPLSFLQIQGKKTAR